MRSDVFCNHVVSVYNASWCILCVSNYCLPFSHPKNWSGYRPDQINKQSWFGVHRFLPNIYWHIPDWPTVNLSKSFLKGDSNGLICRSRMFDCTSLGCSPFESSSLRLQPTATCCNGSSMRKSRSSYNLIISYTSYEYIQVVSVLMEALPCRLGGSWRLLCEGSFRNFSWPRHSIRFRRSVCSTRWDRQPQRRVRKSHCRVRCASDAGATRSRPAKAPARHEPWNLEGSWSLGRMETSKNVGCDEQDSRQSLHSDFDSSLITDEFCRVSVALAFFNCAPALSIPNQQESKCQPPQPCSQVYMFNRCQSWTALRVTQGSAEDRLLGSEEALLVALLASECDIMQQRDIRKFTHIASFRTCARHTSGRHGT